jgi:hypothetical protein
MRLPDEPPAREHREPALLGVQHVDATCTVDVEGRRPERRGLVARLQAGPHRAAPPRRYRTVRPRATSPNGMLGMDTRGMSRVT